MTSRTKLFISYSHDDMRWLQAVKEHLAVLEREGLLDIYEDTQLQAGETWYERLHSEMTSAKVGLLLISAPFLSSGFIRNEEVPRLFDRHASGGMSIFPLLVRPCPWQQVAWLSKLQLRPQDNKRRPKAVSAYSGAARDQVLAEVATEIARLVTGSHSQVLDIRPVEHRGLPTSPAPQSDEARRFRADCMAFRDRRVGGIDSTGKRFLGDIYTDKTPAKLPLSSLFVAVHVFPSNAFDEETKYELASISQKTEVVESLNVWEPPSNWRKRWTLSSRFNSDGLLFFHEKLDYAQQYVQFKNCGIVEAVDHALMGEVLHSRTIPGEKLEAGVLRITQSILTALQCLGGKLPLVVSLTVRGDLQYVKLAYPGVIGSTMGRNTDLLVLPLVEVPSFKADLQILLRPAFDALAQAGGFPASPSQSAAAE